MNTPAKERWTLTFTPEGDGPDTAIRVRILLKRALRQHGLRCIHMAMTPALDDAANVIDALELEPRADQDGKRRNRKLHNRRNGMRMTP